MERIKNEVEGASGLSCEEIRKSIEVQIKRFYVLDQEGRKLPGDLGVESWEACVKLVFESLLVMHSQRSDFDEFDHITFHVFSAFLQMGNEYGASSQNCLDGAIGMLLNCIVV